ncbi:hypothetical protein GOP47_0012643 [Adiantum capillus-veneris]|uniref:PPM-type phosphatase domain-containing protein n=1 Tax=Adiantum capillus-veneris TaxID=13818 RepID=A0A9D4US62_ADICA|nr:hypothetical protein GOP47_0012643 [Adiantum capillus-veneris]
MGVCMSTLILDEEGLLKGRLKRKLAAPSLNSTEEGHDNKLCSNGVSSSCCAHTKQGRKGINQDCFLAWESFGPQGEATFCGIFDGHGPSGHHVAKQVRDCLPNLLLDDECVSLYMSNNSQELVGGSPKHLKPDADALISVSKAFVDCYGKMDDKLKMHPELNCVCSGTTSVTLLVKKKELVIANVGDSRAILVSRGEGASLRVEQLTVDFKPDLPGELERIRNCKGRVFALEDEPEVARIWLPNENKPGLAMARALGDFCLKEYGLSAVPHVYHRQISEVDEFVVLATDGVWDVMSNEEVASVVDKAEPKGLAAKNVVDAAVKKWKCKFSHVRMDDCAVRNLNTACKLHVQKPLTTTVI